MTRRSSVAVALSALLLAVAGCADGNDSAYQGALIGAAEPGPTGERWIALVELDGAEVGGSSTVQVAFDTGDVQCRDGSRTQPDEISLDAAVSFERVGSDFDAMSPPIIAARSVVVAC